MLHLLTFGTCLLLTFDAVYSLTTPAQALAKVQDALKDNQPLDEEIHDIVTEYKKLSEDCPRKELMQETHLSLRGLEERIFNVEWQTNNVFRSVKKLRKNQISILRTFHEKELLVSVNKIQQSSESGGIFEELSRSPCIAYKKLTDLIVRLYEVIVHAQVKALAALKKIDSLDLRSPRNDILTPKFNRQLSELYGLVRNNYADLTERN